MKLDLSITEHSLEIRDATGSAADMVAAIAMVTKSLAEAFAENTGLPPAEFCASVAQTIVHFFVNHTQKWPEAAVQPAEKEESK